MKECGNCEGGASVAAVAPASTRKTVAIVGPPNAGKSTLFNALTGLRQKVANFPGVTVEHHIGLARLPNGIEVELVDLPGVYSLEPRSEDERVTRCKAGSPVYKNLTPSC
jgi:ferrous iron transport protein B